MFLHGLRLVCYPVINTPLAQISKSPRFFEQTKQSGCKKVHKDISQLVKGPFIIVDQPTSHNAVICYVSWHIRHIVLAGWKEKDCKLFSPFLFELLIFTVHLFFTGELGT